MLTRGGELKQLEIGFLECPYRYLYTNKIINYLTCRQYFYITESMDSYNNKVLVKQFIDRLISVYKYNRNQLAEDYCIDGDVKVDIAIWRDDKSKGENNCPDIFVIVVCKEEYVTINHKEYFNVNPSLISHPHFYVAHNLKETKVFYSDPTNVAIKYRRIGDFPKATDILTDDTLRAFIRTNREYSKDALQDALKSCHNIIRNIDKLSPEAAFDEISKVLFIKLLYEAKPDAELVYTLEKFKAEEKEYQNEYNSDYMQILFDKVKDEYNQDGIFDVSEKIRIRRNTFERILDELSSINLYDTDEDIKGVAFETFLGKTFRGELGQFFTPRSVVEYMIKILDIKEGDLVCDPCCGSGGFLINTFTHLQNIIDKDIKAQVETVRNDATMTESEKCQRIANLYAECNRKKVGSRYYKLCHNYLFGVDANARMVRTSKMNMIMHGDGHVGIYHHDGLLNVGGVYDGRFDVILINPPFGAHVEKSQRVLPTDCPTTDEAVVYAEQFGTEYTMKVAEQMEEMANYVNRDGTVGKPILSLYKINKSNTELLFIERCLNLLKPGGRAGLVLPEGIMGASSYNSIRKFVQEHAQILNITSIPADVFFASGANVKPALLFVRKYTESELIERKNDYTLTITRINDAGINSLGLLTETNELPRAADEVLERMDSINRHKDTELTHQIMLSDMCDWNILSCFDVTKVKYNSKFPLVKLSELLFFNDQKISIIPDMQYTRLTVRLFAKGITERDTLMGKDIGTKRQTPVRAGQFVISKIDGKSGALGIIPSQYEGAIVTQDFLTFDINTNRVLPDYLMLVMQNEDFYSQFKDTSVGSTGRRRLSQKTLMNTSIALPSLTEQHEMLVKYKDLLRQQMELEKMIEEQKQLINSRIFEEA